MKTPESWIKPPSPARAAAMLDAASQLAKTIKRSKLTHVQLTYLIREALDKAAKEAVETERQSRFENDIKPRLQ